MQQYVAYTLEMLDMGLMRLKIAIQGLLPDVLVLLRDRL